MMKAASKDSDSQPGDELEKGPEGSFCLLEMAVRSKDNLTGFGMKVD